MSEQPQRIVCPRSLLRSLDVWHQAQLEYLAENTDLVSIIEDEQRRGEGK